ncbi:hypothetical protein Hamer_G024337, partial [Homarus americanus]
VDEAQVIRYPLTTNWPSGQQDATSVDLPTYSATLGLVLPARRDLAPHGSFKLRCRVMVEELEWVTEVQVGVERPLLGEPHHLPALLNTAVAPTSAMLSTSHRTPQPSEFNLVTPQPSDTQPIDTPAK